MCVGGGGGARLGGGGQSHVSSQRLSVMLSCDNDRSRKKRQMVEVTFIDEDRRTASVGDRVVRRCWVNVQ